MIQNIYRFTKLKEFEKLEMPFPFSNILIEPKIFGSLCQMPFVCKGK